MVRRIVILGWLVALLAGCGRVETRPEARPARGLPRVCATSYPLAFFAGRLAEGDAEVSFPAPGDQDPAFWRPSEAVIRQFQQADLILLNGADFEKWVNTTSLPMAPLVDTSVAFKSEWILFPEVITHSHGPQGAHSHGNIDFNTWLDPILAVRQMGVVAGALRRIAPADEAGLRRREGELRRDLIELDRELRELGPRLRGRPLLASHPVYGYLARRYQWDLASVHWEPDEPVTPAQWVAFDTLRAGHPGRLMIWEEAPLPAVAAGLAERGVRPVVFRTCGNRPPAGDYLAAMHENIRVLREAAAAGP